jgi:signal transduction histidine kinase
MAQLQPVFSKRKGDRRLVLLVVLLSLGLAGLTVWAVARQGRALQERDWADLHKRAQAAAAEYSIALQADVSRAFDAAGARLYSDGLPGLDRWLDEEHGWSYAVLCAPEQTVLLPSTPTQAAAASTQPDAQLPRYEPDMSGGEVRQVLARCEQLLDAENLTVRVRAHLTIADCYRQLGDSAAAVQALESAAQILRSQPDSLPRCFESLVDVVGCLAEANALDQARSCLTTLLEQIARSSPARYAPEEVEFLRRRAAAVLSAPDPGDLPRQLDELVQRAAIRRIAPEVLAAAREACAGGDVAEQPLTLQSVQTEGAPSQLMAIRKFGPDRCMALSQSFTEALAHLSVATQPWCLAQTPGERDVVLARLDDSFGGAALVASEPTLGQMRAQARRRSALVLVTAAGTAGAWGVVIWMMLRAMAHQRELVRLQRRFVADVSHELKTPLAMIRLLSETLLDGRVSDPERVRSYHGTITREAERLSVLLDSILDFSRIESGRRQYDFESCDFAVVARQAWSLFEPQFAGAGFEHHLDIEPNLPVVRADAAAVQQVMVNLLQNAFRYAGDGKYVRLAINRDGYVIVVTVEDHGIGMTRSQLQRLGDTFFRAEDTRVRQTRGSGLGLAIVNHIVQAHGGKMEVHSRPNHGSKFTVWFPFDPQKT